MFRSLQLFSAMKYCITGFWSSAAGCKRRKFISKRTEGWFMRCKSSLVKRPWEESQFVIPSGALGGAGGSMGGNSPGFGCEAGVESVSAGALPDSSASKTSLTAAKASATDGVVPLENGKVSKAR